MVGSVNQVLERSDLLENVPDAVRDAVLSRARKRTVAARDVIYSADDTIDGVFIVVDGCVATSQLTRNGEEVVLRIATVGELFGELGGRQGERYTATARALHDSEILVWSVESFENLLERFPVLQKNVNSILGQRIGELADRIRRIATKAALNRVASQLIHLSDQMGQQVDGHVEIYIHQEALAQMTAMNIFTMNRTLSGLENQGLLKIRRQCIEIHDTPGLVGLCM